MSNHRDYRDVRLAAAALIELIKADTWHNDIWAVAYGYAMHAAELAFKAGMAEAGSHERRVLKEHADRGVYFAAGLCGLIPRSDREVAA